MWVDNFLDHSNGWYLPLPNDPPNGGCGTPNPQGLGRTTMFTDVKYTINQRTTTIVQALFGITACPSHFDAPTLLDLGTPVTNGQPSEIRKFSETADLEDLHELFHLVSDGGTSYETSLRLGPLPDSFHTYTDFHVEIIDQQAMVPPVADPLYTDQWTWNRNFASWIPSAVIQAYGYFYTMFLGLARPLNARLNADNFAIFAMCMYFPELKCTGAFETDLPTKRSVPRGVSPRAVEKIRSAGSNLTSDLHLNQEPTSSGEEGDFDPGFGEKGKSRFKDINRPSGMLG